MKTTSKVEIPEDFLSAFRERFNSGEVDRVVAAYHPDAILNLGDGKIFRGHSEIRVAIAQFMAAKLRIVVSPKTLTVSSGTAVVVFDWSIEGNTPEGNHVTMSGQAIDVLIKNAQNEWQQLIDRPLGSATPLGQNSLPATN